MKKQVLFIIMMLMPLMASASTNINGIYYNLNSTNKVAEVTSVPSGTAKYSGSIVIPKTVAYGGVTYSVTSIGYNAFFDCSSLTSVDIPNSVTAIGEHAFYGCTGLTSITIPNSVTSIGYNAFYSCSGLTKVIVPDINAWCKISFEPHYPEFYYDEDGQINFYSNPLRYAGHIYSSQDTEITELVLSNSTTEINDGAFWGCIGITSVTIPNSVTTIGDCAFFGCSSLTSVTIPNSVKYIGYGAFLGCRGLTSVIIPNSVTSIGYYAFRGCSSLTSVTIPNSVTSIGFSAFSMCTSLPIIDNCRYADTYLVEVVDKTIATCTIKEGTRFLEEFAFSGCSSLTSVTIPNSVTSISSNAFSGCCSLTSISIPSSVTSIESGAFFGCSSLTSVTIPNSVTSIEDTTFGGCTGVKAVYITDVTNWCLLTVGKQLLSPTCHLYINGVDMNTLKNLVIPNDVSFIQDGAFKYCTGLTSVSIGNGVTSIRSQAFYECSDVTSVTIGSGIQSIGSKAFANYNNLTDVYCFADEVPTTSSDVFDNSYVKYATLHVPESSLNLYKRSEPWSQFGNIVGITGGNEGERCEKPTITLLANGKIKVESATEEATCVTSISASTANPLTDGEISLNIPLIVYTVTAYATAEGYDDSEVATATFRFEGNKGDVDGDGKIDISDLTQLVNIILGQ